MTAPGSRIMEAGMVEGDGLATGVDTAALGRSVVATREALRKEVFPAGISEKAEVWLQRVVERWLQWPASKHPDGESAGRIRRAFQTYNIGDQAEGIHLHDAAVVAAFRAVSEEGTPLRREGMAAATYWEDEARQLSFTFNERYEDWVARGSPRLSPLIGESFAEWAARGEATVARMLWFALVKPEVDAEIERLGAMKHPALAAEVLRATRDALWIPGRRVGGTDLAPVLVDERGQVLARFNVGSVPEVPEEALRFKVAGPDAEDNLRATRSIAGQKLLRFIVETVYRQYNTPGFHEPNVIEIVGGYRRLAQLLGEDSRKAEDNLRRTLQFLHLAEPATDLVDFRGFVLVFEYPGAPGKKSLLRITVADPFTPGYASRLTGKSLTARAARRMVPVTTRMPPLVDPRRYHPEQVALQQQALAELRAHASELVADGYATIPRPRWLEIAGTVGLPAVMLDRVLDAWAVAGPEQFLVREGTSYRFTLADTYAQELHTILEAGRDSVDGAAYQKKSRRARKPWRRKKATGGSTGSL